MKQNETTVVKLRDYLMNISEEELTERLKYLDKAISELHNHGYYVVGDLANIDIINGEVTLDSFRDKIDYSNSGINEQGKNQNILQLCCIGICAYNRLSVLYTSKDFITYVINNVEMFLEHGNIPSAIQEYYIDVFNRGKVDYLNGFLSKNFDNTGTTRENSKGSYQKVLATDVGRSFSQKDSEEVNNNIISLDEYRNRKNNKYNPWEPYGEETSVGKTLSRQTKTGFASVLLLPALLALIYIVTVVVFMFIK